MRKRRQFIRSALPLGARWVGAVIAFGPAGIVAAADDITQEMVAETLPTALIGAALMFPALGLTPEPGNGRVIRWYGLAFEPVFALPLYRRVIPLSSLTQIMIRGIRKGTHRHSGSTGYRVLLIPASGYDDRIGVTDHVFLAGAEKRAAELAGALGLPLERG